MEDVKKALAAYGASLDEDGFIVRQGRTGIRVVIKHKKLCFMGGEHLMASGPISASRVESFVENFWFWKKVSS